MDEGYSGQTADPTGAEETCLDEETSPDGVATVPDVVIDLDEVIVLDEAIALEVVIVQCEVIVPEVERSLDDWTGPTWVTGQELVTVLVQETFLAVLALATFLEGLVVQDQDCHLQVVVSSF